MRLAAPQLTRAMKKYSSTIIIFVFMHTYYFYFKRSQAGKIKSFLVDIWRFRCIMIVHAETARQVARGGIQPKNPFEWTKLNVMHVETG
jgi:hypothetical protein